MKYPRLFQLALSFTLICWAFAAPACLAENPSRDETYILPEIELFPPIVADQREYIFSVRIEDRRQANRDSQEVEVSFGDSLPIKNISLSEHSKLQFTFDGVFYALYDLRTNSDDLVNTDFYVGFSTVYRVEDFSVRLRVRHKSSHLGDEYVIAHPDKERENPSFEEVRLLPAYEWAGFRIYGGGGFIFRSHDNAKRASFQNGLEYFYPLEESRFSLFVAADLQSEARANWRLNESYRAGVEIGEQNMRNIRIALEFVNGYAQDGQFTEENSSYYGFAVYFQL